MNRSLDEFNGFVLLSTLFLLSLLALIGTWSWRNLGESLKTQARNHHSDLIRVRANTSALSSLPVTGSWNPGIYCNAVREHAGTLRLERSLCYEVPLLPLINFSNLYFSTGSCSSRLSQSTHTSPLGKTLSPSSLISTNTCQAPGTPTVMRENISIPGSFSLPLTSTSSALPSLSVLAATGFIETAGALKIEGNTAIVAGGDISLDALETQKTVPLSAFILSSTGSIVIGEVSSKIHIEAYAAEGVYLPALTSNMPGLMNIPKLKWYVLGLS